jgi:hypothetical protein
VFSWLLRQRLKDTLCGTKVIWTQDYARLKAGRSYFGNFDPFGDFDLLFGASKLNLKIVEVPVRHHARVHGTSKYGIDRTIRVLLDLLWIKFLLRFLHRPIHAFGGLGLGMGLLGGLILLWLSFEKLVLGQSIGGRPLLLLGALLVLIGVQLVGTGLLGEMLTRIYHEPQGRPQYMTRSAPRPAPRWPARAAGEAERTTE